MQERKEESEGSPQMIMNARERKGESNNEVRQNLNQNVISKIEAEDFNQFETDTNTIKNQEKLNEINQKLAINSDTQYKSATINNDDRLKQNNLKQIENQNRVKQVVKNEERKVKQSQKSKLKEAAPNKSLKISVLQKEKKPIIANDQLNQKELEEKIKEIANSIRKKVKKDDDKQRKKQIQDHKDNQSSQNKGVKRKQREIILQPLRQNPGITNFNVTSPTKLLTFQQEQINIQVKNRTIVKEIINKDILGNLWKRIELEQKIAKNKLRLDPIKHRYPVTSFRKAVLEENKHLHLKDQQLLKQKKEKLMKRRDIYNSSRYQRYIKESPKRSIIMHQEYNNQQLAQIQNPETSATVQHQPETIQLLVKDIPPQLTLYDQAQFDQHLQM